MSRSLCFIYLSCLCALFTSCGYRFESATAHDTQRIKKTLAIPYVVGDLDGTFTSQLTYQMAAVSPMRITRKEPDYLLKVSITSVRSEEVGYIRPQQNGQSVKWITPNENRLSKLALVELVETASGKTVFGPEYISANLLYDFDPTFNVNNFVRFSLAQYNFQQIAQRFATVAVDKRLALSIAEQISYACHVKDKLN